MTLYIGLAIIAAVVLVSWVFAYVGTRLVAYTAVLAAAAVGMFVGADSLVGAIVFGVLAALTLPFVIVPIRRAVISKGVFKWFKNQLPPMSSTEREALEAGDVWWEGEMFAGRPNWEKLLNFKRTELTEEEQSFLDNETNELCAMIDDWKVQHEDKDLSPEAWAFIREKGFLSMLISKEWGGKGFSALAQSNVVSKIATRSVAAAVTVMVPNSLGPGELLMHYGTEEQKKFWLPGLSDGTHIPCFGLTGPEAGSDAGAVPDTAIVCEGEYNGEKQLGMRITLSKRYITLAPISTVIGLALQLHDPEGLLGDANKVEYGITCVLIPSDLEGVEIGRRHFPSGSAFMNGPINGQDIFVPIDWIIGGREKAGKGWRMLVECLSAGRGISLPALATASGKASYINTGAYTRIRRQFKMPVGKFEGVQEAMGRMAGLTYTMEALRTLTASAVDNCSPSVVTAIAKYHMTEMMRVVMTDGMDIHGGRAVMMGPRNYLANPFNAIPIAITVEGANILTRNLMIFGQGAVRCHPFVFPEMEAARDDDLKEYDKLFWAHINYTMNRTVRTFTMGLTGGLFVGSPKSDFTAKYFKRLTRMSSAMAFMADLSMAVLGGDLKRKERMSARLGDILSHLYIGSAVLKFYYDEGEREIDRPHVEWALQHSLAEIRKAIADFTRNFGFIGKFMNLIVFPFGSNYAYPDDKLSSAIADAMMEPTALRERLEGDCYVGDSMDDQSGRMKLAFDKLIEVEPVYNKFARAVAKGQAIGFTTEAQLESAVANGVLTDEEAKQVAEYDAMRFDAIITDAFTKEYLAGKEVTHDAGVARSGQAQPMQQAAGGATPKQAS